MIYLLLLLLIFHTIVIYIFSNHQLLRPSQIYNISFVVVAIIYCCLNRQIGYRLSFETVLIIYCSSVVFALGDIVGANLRLRIKSSNSNGVKERSDLFIPYKHVYIITGIIIITTGIRIVAISNVLGTGLSISEILKSYAILRNTLVAGNSLNLPGWVSYISVFTLCASHVFLYLYIHDRLINNKRVGVYLLPVGFYILFLFTTTTRTDFFNFISFGLLSVCFILYNTRSHNLELTNTIFRSVIKALIIFFVVFYVVGLIANKMSRVLDAIESYTAAAYVGLDKFLSSDYTIPPWGSKRTIQGLLAIIAKFGFSFPEVDSFLPHFWYEGKTSNIYTCLMEPILDFGIGGMLLTRFVLGFVYSRIYKAICEQISGRCECAAIVLISSMYPLVIASIDDQFISYIGSYYIYQIIANYLIMRFIVKRRPVEI